MRGLAKWCLGITLIIVVLMVLAATNAPAGAYVLGLIVLVMALRKIEKWGRGRKPSSAS